VTQDAITRASQEHEITSLDDVPKAAATGRRQRFLLSWFYALAGAPIFIAVIVSVKFFNESRGAIWIVGATLIWAIGISLYSLYLLLFFQCPRCHTRFGTSEQCSGCDLQRHWNTSLNFSKIKETE
jgi:hypothetical protein